MIADELPFPIFFQRIFCNQFDYLKTKQNNNNNNRLKSKINRIYTTNNNNGRSNNLPKSNIDVRQIT